MSGTLEHSTLLRALLPLGWSQMAITGTEATVTVGRRAIQVDQGKGGKFRQGRSPD